MSTSAKISYDRVATVAIFNGPGGFTHHPMREEHAYAIALALGVPFEVVR
jgi:hypothetical protein